MKNTMLALYVLMNMSQAFSLDVNRVAACWDETIPYSKSKVDTSIEYLNGFDKKNVDALYFISQCQIRNKQFDNAVKNLTHLIDINKFYPFAHQLRGLANFELSEYDRSVMDFEISISQSLGDLGAVLYLGRSLEQLGELDQAKSTILDVINSYVSVNSFSQSSVVTTYYLEADFTRALISVMLAGNDWDQLESIFLRILSTRVVTIEMFDLIMGTIRDSGKGGTFESYRSKFCGNTYYRSSSFCG